MGMIRSILPAFLSFRFLNTEMMTSRLPNTSTTVVKINTLARIPMTQAGRALPSAASARSSWPSRSSVRFLMRVNVSGITRPSTAACSRVPTVLYVLQVPPAPPRPKSNMKRTWAPHELQKSALGVCRELLTCRNLKHWSHVGFCIFLCKKIPIFVPPGPDWTRHTFFLWKNDEYLPSWNDQNWQKASAYHSYFRSPSS